MVFGGGPVNNSRLTHPLAGMVITETGCDVGVCFKMHDPSVLPISMQTPFPDFRQLSS
jgi:hypothetical protein